jgi:hypothetical protein
MGAHATEQKKQKAKETEKCSEFRGYKLKVKNIFSKEGLHYS